MHLREEVVLQALQRLENVHPFFGITFLVCKRQKLPLGKMTRFAINSAEGQFLCECYHPDLKSKFFFSPFRTSSRLGRWLSPKYPSSGSQKTRTQGDLAAAFLHDRNTDLWGWAPSYVDVLRQKLDRDRTDRVPAFWLAVWLYRNTEWPGDTTARAVVRALTREFFLTKGELDALFDLSPPEFPNPLLTPEPFDDGALLRHFGPAPDASPEEGGTLRVLSLRDVGPGHELEFNPAERLSIITGDNGLGKTFLLECAWWSLTGVWAEQQALPIMQDSRRPPSITFAIAGANGHETPQRRTIQYNWNTQSWPEPQGRPTLPGLVVYARVDGSFAVWDPARHGAESGSGSRKLLFSRDQVLDGLGGKIEGLIRDWVRWQSQRDQSTFSLFCRVLERLSPPDMAPLQPGDPVRLPNEARDIPTLRHDYALVPFTNEAAGVRRIATIAYLLVWAWNEHRVFSSLAKKAPQRKMVILIDEAEAHLHPKWQRVVLPALLDVTGLLSQEVKPQMIVVTHSPLILASMEGTFSNESDKLFHLCLRDNSQVELEEAPFIRCGSVDAWLTSDLFELKQARSREGEDALEQAKSLLAASSSDVGRIRGVHARLIQALPAEDPFWPGGYTLRKGRASCCDPRDRTARAAGFRCENTRARPDVPATSPTPDKRTVQKEQFLEGGPA